MDRRNNRRYGRQLGFGGAEALEHRTLLTGFSGDAPAVGSLASSAVVQAASPAGSEFRVNTYTANAQAFPAIAADADGDFVVAWQSYGQDPNTGVYAQRYNAAGAAQGPEFRVPTTTAANQTRPAVAMAPGGAFVVVWESPDGSETGVFGQRYNAAGFAQGREFRANTYTTNVQRYPAVAMDATGDFVITWASTGQDVAPTDGIYAQRYDAAGVAQGGEFRANTITAQSQRYPTVAMDAAGDFVIAWHSDGQDPDGSTGIYAQRYDPVGATRGPEFRVNTFTQSNQAYPAVAMDDDGDFVVSWSSYNQEAGGGAGVYAQRYDAAGAAQGAEIHVNTFTAGHQRESAVAMDADGDFAVIWHSYYQDPGAGLTGIYGQRFTKIGAADGGEFRVNTTTAGHQRYPAVAMDASGDFVVAWASYGQDPGDNAFVSGVYAQRYSVPDVQTITQVYVRGQTWAGIDANASNVTFKEYLDAKGLGHGEFGFRVDNLPAGTTVPWINVNQIVLRYAQPVGGAGIPAAGSVVLDGQNSDYAVTAVAQLDPLTIVLTLNRALGIQPPGSSDVTLGDRVSLSIPGAGPGGVAYNLMLNVLQGDTDRAANNRVATTDVNFTKARLNRTSSEVPPGGAAYTAFADLNGDGRILTLDVNATKARLNDILPAALPAAAALFNDSRIAEEVLA